MEAAAAGINTEFIDNDVTSLLAESTDFTLGAEIDSILKEPKAQLSLAPDVTKWILEQVEQLNTKFSRMEVKFGSVDMDIKKMKKQSLAVARGLDDHSPWLKMEILDTLDVKLSGMQEQMSLVEYVAGQVAALETSFDDMIQRHVTQLQANIENRITESGL